MSQESANISESSKSEERENSKASESPKSEKRDNSKVSESPKSEERDHSKLSESPKSEERDHSKVSESSKSEERDHSKVSESPKSEERDHSKVSESPKSEERDHSKVSESPKSEESDNSKVSESLKSEEIENPKGSESSKSEERQNLKERKNRRKSAFDIPFRKTIVHAALHAIRTGNRKRDLQANDENRAGGTRGKLNWASETDLILNCIGFSVGLGNLWRFPYVAFKYGGGAFLIPYLIITFVISVPLYNMELILGQFSGLDPIRVWSFCPLFKGLGITIILSTLVVQVYYSVIMSYALFYTLQTFQEPLPWSGCFKWWGADENCYRIDTSAVLCKVYSGILVNPPENCTNGTESSADQFWRKFVLGLSSGLDDPGTIKWDLALCLLATWIIVCALVIARHHTKVKVKFKTVYFTAFFPFAILIVCFFYILSREGAFSGLKTLFIPQWMSLLDFKVWSEAAQASLFSVGLGMGGLIMFGSKNEFRYNIFRCAMISSMADLFASVFSASVTFMVIGALANDFNLTASNITLSGNGLIFMTYPDAVLNMAIPQLWAFAFFVMLFTLAVDSSIAMTETLSIGIGVLFCPTKIYSRKNVILTASVLYLLGLSCVTNGGAFLINILDNYGGGHAVMGTVMIEAIAFGWGYGVEKACSDVQKIQGSKPTKYTKFCWSFVAPVVLIVLFIQTLCQDHLQPLYNIQYPRHGSVIGYVILTVILLPVPIFMVVALYRYRKAIKKVYKPGNVWRKAISDRYQIRNV